MKNKLIIFLLVIAVVMCQTTAFAANINYRPGIYEYRQEIVNPEEVKNASVSSKEITLSADGMVKYNFTLPFDAAKLKVTYAAAADTTLNIVTDRMTYQAVLPGAETSAEIRLLPERVGEFNISFSSDADLSIKELRYIKVEQVSDERLGGEIQYETEFDDALQSIIVAVENCNVIKVKGAMRWVNAEDTKDTTYVVDGRMYLPVGTIARAFDLYYEDYADLNYAYISGEDFAWYMKDALCWYEKAGSKKHLNNLSIYKNGKLYIPLRQFAEIAGYTVEYVDGIVLIGKDAEIKRCTDSETIMAELKTKFSKYKVSTESDGVCYHVAKTRYASDSNPGTEEFPFLTIQKAADVATAGDTVIIHGGIYREDIEFPSDGTETKPIIFQAAEGEEVVVSAFEEVTGFAPYTNPDNGVSMYVKDVSNLEFKCEIEGSWKDDRNFVIYNDDVLLEGRHPNSKTSVEKTQTRINKVKKIDEEEVTFKETPDFNPAYPYFETNKILPTQGDMRVRDVTGKGVSRDYFHTVESDIDLNQEKKDYWKGATFVTFIGKAWSMSVAEVTESEKGKATIVDHYVGKFGVTYYQDRFMTDYGFLTNHLNTVDMPGEWYIDNEAKNMYIIPPENVDINTFKPEVKSRQLVMDLTNRKYIQIKNINTRGGGITMNHSEGCILDGGVHKFISQMYLSSEKDPNRLCIYYTAPGVEGRSIQDDAPEFGEVGFYIGGNNNAVINTDIEYSAGAGLYITGKYNYIENNVIDKTGYGCAYPCGIYITNKRDGEKVSPQGGHAVYQNTSRSAYRAAIGMSYAYDSLSGLDNGAYSVTTCIPVYIAYNDCAWSNIAARDTGVIYYVTTVGGNERERTVIHHNMFHDSVSSNEDSLLTVNHYADGLTATINVYDNISYHSNDDPKYSNRHYFFQTSNISGFIGDRWSNMSKSFNKDEEVKFDVLDYPNGKPFKAGAHRGNERFMDNYSGASRANTVFANETELSNGAYIDEQGYAILPNADSSLSGTISAGTEGTKVIVYYSADQYNKTLYNVPELTLTLSKDGQEIYKSAEKVMIYGRYLDSVTGYTFYIPPQANNELDFKINCTTDDLNFIKIAAEGFDYNAENAKREFPYEAKHIAFGTCDEYTERAGNTKPSFSTDFSAEAVENLTYSQYGNTWEHLFKFKNRELNSFSNLVFVASTSNNFNKTKAKIKLTDVNTGVEKEIGYVDFSTGYPAGMAWHTENIRGVLYEPVAAGTYDITVDFGAVDPNNKGCVNANALVFY